MVESLAARSYSKIDPQGHFAAYGPGAVLKRFSVNDDAAFWADYRDLFARGEELHYGEMAGPVAPIVLHLLLEFAEFGAPLGPPRGEEPAALGSSAPEPSTSGARAPGLGDSEEDEAPADDAPEPAEDASDGGDVSDVSDDAKANAPEPEDPAPDSDVESAGEGVEPLARESDAAPSETDPGELLAREVEAVEEAPSTRAIMAPFVVSFVKALQTIVERQFLCDSDGGTSFCVVTGSEAATLRSGNRAVAVCFQMPYAHVGRQVLADQVLPELAALLMRENIPSKLPCAPLGDWQRTIAASAGPADQPLYGSTRGRDDAPLLLWAAYKPLGTTAFPQPATIRSGFELRQHALFRLSAAEDPDFALGWSEEEQLILFLSQGYFGRPLRPRQRPGSAARPRVPPAFAAARRGSAAASASSFSEFAPPVLEGSAADIGERLARAARFIEMLSPEALVCDRVRQEEVARVLFGIAGTSEEGLGILVDRVHRCFSELLRQRRGKQAAGPFPRRPAAPAPSQQGAASRPAQSSRDLRGKGPAARDDPMARKVREFSGPLDYSALLQAGEELSRLEIKRDLVTLYVPRPALPPLTEKTLAWYAREESRDEFRAWHDEAKTKALEAAASGLEADVAEAFYQLNWLNLAYDGKTRCWYSFSKNRWQGYEDSVVELTRLVDDFFISDIAAFAAAVTTQASGAGGRERDERLELSNQLTKLARRLKGDKFPRAMLRRAASKFLIKNFSAHLDSHPHLVGARNGVIEVLPGTARFRPGKPEDYISKALGVDYPCEFDSNRAHPALQLYNKYLCQVHRNPEIRHFFRLLLASFLARGNTEKIFDIWSGDTNNSKSVYVKIVQRGLGDYCIDFATTMITGAKVGTEAPTPQLAQAKGALVAFMVEPDDKEQVQGGTVKMLTGGDRFFARYLNQNGGSIENTVKIIMVCNAIPPVPRGDKAVVARLMVVPWLSTWSDVAPESEDEQMRLGVFKIDPFFERNIPELARAMVWTMVQDFAEYRREGLRRPQAVVQRTSLYWETTDLYRCFIGECFAHSGDDTDVVSATDFYINFKDWFSRTCPGMKADSRLQFAERLKSLIGAPNGPRGAWKGWHAAIVNI